MTTVAIAPFPSFYDASGDPAAGYRIYTYAAGTSTPLASYTDRSGSVANANPIVLDSAGRCACWLTVNVAYKLVFATPAGTPITTVDNYYAGADPSQLVAAGIVPATGGTYTGLVDFTGGATFSGTPAQDLTTLDSLGISAARNANLWINPDFAIAQRTIGSIADGAYGFDRTVNLCDTGSTTLSQLSQPADGMQYAMRILQPDASPKRMGFSQIVEAANVVAYRGKNLVLAARVRCSIATTVRIALVAWTGTLDAPTRDVVNTWASTTYTAGNFFVASTSTIAVTATAISANTFTDILVSSASPGGVVVPSTMNNLYMVVWTDQPVAQNVTLDASLMQCGQGTLAQLWTPIDYASEYAKCQRYFEVGATNTTMYGLASNNHNYTIPFAARKRVSPTVTFPGGVATSNTTGAGSSSPGVGQFLMLYTVTATGMYAVSGTWNATAEF